MPGTKEIRLKIRSVQNTRKITKAMEMVAASKMRKAQQGMRRARPYGEKIRNVAAHISHANPEYRHPFLVELGDRPQMEKLIGAVKVMLDGYTQDRFDRLMLFYTRFINTMKQEPVMEQLLPLSGERLGSPASLWDYIYEPEAKAVLEQVLTRYIETRQAGITKEISEIVGGAAAV